MDKRILVVVENIDVNKSSGAKANVALIKNLALCGYKVHVLHYTLKQIEIEGVDCVAIKEIRSSRNFIASRLERLLRYKFKIDIHERLEKIWGFSFTLFNDRNSIIKAIKKIDFAPDLVFTLSQGGSFRPHHALLKLPEFHNKWVAYIHDPYPMHTYPRPYDWVEPGNSQKWEFMKSVSFNARYSAFPSKILKEWMESYLPAFQHKSLILPHQIDSDISIKASNALKYWDEKKFNLLHAGTMLQARNPNCLLRAFQKFIDHGDEEIKNNSRLFLIGSSDFHVETIQKFSKQTSQIINYNKNIPFIETVSLQHKAAVNIILEAKSEISPFLPGKFPHCVMANRPIFVIGPGLSETNRLLGDKHQLKARVDDEEMIFQIIQLAYKEWKMGIKELNRPELKDYLSVKYLKENIDAILNKL